MFFEVWLTNNGWRYKSLNLFVLRCSEVTTPAAADQLFDLFHCRWRSNLRSTFGCWTAWLLMIHNHEIVFWLPDFHRRSTLEWTAKLGWLFHRVSTYYYSFWLHYKNHWKLYLVKFFPRIRLLIENSYFAQFWIVGNSINSNQVDTFHFETGRNIRYFFHYD